MFQFLVVWSDVMVFLPLSGFSVTYIFPLVLYFSPLCMTHGFPTVNHFSPDVPFLHVSLILCMIMVLVFAHCHCFYVIFLLFIPHLQMRMLLLVGSVKYIHICDFYVFAVFSSLLWSILSKPSFVLTWKLA